MTKKKFIKLATETWHRWTADTHGKLKKDLPLKMFLERHVKRAAKKGFIEEYETIKRRFTPYKQ